MSYTPTVHLVSGILGSGKTTFCQHLLDAPNPEGQYGIVVGEYAGEGYDAEPLKATGAIVRQISAMQHKEQAPAYMEQMHRLRDMGCARILLETSGITAISATSKALKKELADGTVRLGRSCVVVDAAAFVAHQTTFPEQLWAQVDVADLLIINKTDKVDPAEVYATRDACQARNPHAQVAFAYMGQINRSDVFGPEPEGFQPRLLHVADSDAPVPQEFDAFVFRSQAICIDRIKFGHLLLNLPGKVARFKGVLRCWDKCYGINGMPGQLDYDNAPVSGKTWMAFIGIGIDALEDEIKTLLEDELQRQLADDDR